MIICDFKIVIRQSVRIVSLLYSSSQPLGNIQLLFDSLLQWQQHSATFFTNHRVIKPISYLLHSSEPLVAFTSTRVIVERHAGDSFSPTPQELSGFPCVAKRQLKVLTCSCYFLLLFALLTTMQTALIFREMQLFLDLPTSVIFSSRFAGFQTNY